MNFEDFPKPQAPLSVEENSLPLSSEGEVCWVCGYPTLETHCKIVCPNCGFTRDCSDP